MVAIFVVLTILICVSIDAFLEKRRVLQTTGQKVPVLKETWELPQQTYLFPGHTWAELNNAPSYGVRVGIDALFSLMLGKMDRLYTLPVGTRLMQGEPMLTVEKNGRQFTLSAPISGEIEAQNANVISNPDTLQKSAYGDSWIYKIHPSLFLSEDRRVLQTGQRAHLWLESEYRRLANWLTTGHTLRTELAMQDGGLPAPGVLTHLNETEWANFQAQFLNQHHSPAR